MNPRIVLRVVACIVGLGAVYAVLAMFTQAMLGGASAQEIWWDRIYAWWVDFLATGWLLMLAIYLWRRSTRNPSAETPSRTRSAWRVALFPLAHMLLTGCLYFADFGSYVADYPGEQERGSTPATYFGVATLLAVGAAAVFWCAHRLKDSRGEIGGVAG